VVRRLAWAIACHLPSVQVGNLILSPSGSMVMGSVLGTGARGTVGQHQGTQLVTNVLLDEGHSDAEILRLAGIAMEMDPRVLVNDESTTGFMSKLVVCKDWSDREKLPIEMIAQPERAIGLAESGERTRLKSLSFSPIDAGGDGDFGATSFAMLSARFVGMDPEWDRRATEWVRRCGRARYSGITDSQLSALRAISIPGWLANLDAFNRRRMAEPYFSKQKFEELTIHEHTIGGPEQWRGAWVRAFRNIGYDVLVLASDPLVKALTQKSFLEAKDVSREDVIWAITANPQAAIFGIGLLIHLKYLTIVAEAESDIRAGPNITAKDHIRRVVMGLRSGATKVHLPEKVLVMLPNEDLGFESPGGAYPADG